MITDRELHNALGRREPPDGFTERTLARIARPQPSRRSAWVAVGVAASLVLAFGATHIVLHQQDADARRAAEKLTLALQITSEKLQDVQHKVFITSQRVENLHDDQLSR
jgi:hypothetical protein